MPEIRKKLLLWDIDGTLLNTGGAGVVALKQAMETEFQTAYTSADAEMDVAGRTDRYIASALLKHFHLEPSAENIHRFLESYLTHLPRQLHTRQGFVHKGIMEILKLAHERTDCVNALLTGNLERGAKLKLSHYAIHHFFEFGAFADDSPQRNDLGPVALTRAKEKHGLEFLPHEVFVIGDTPHDIACGQVIGAHTIAVATGSFPVAELQKHNPTAVFENFSDPARFFEIVDRYEK